MSNRIESRIYPIRSNEDLKALQRDLRADFELQHVSYELGRNMVEEGETGTIEVHQGCVRSIIRKDGGRDWNEVERRLTETLGQVTKACSNGHAHTLDVSTKQRRFGGRGLAMIICMGWSAVLKATSTELVLEARKTFQ